jgi:signal transduction histidine kinase
MELVPTDLGELAISTADQMHLMAEEKNISIRFEVAEDVQAIVDPLRMKQILVNLLDNALKYSPEGGWVKVGVRAERDTAVLTVTDNGIGIAPESLPHVFERFYRADKARTRTTGGTGLGLSIVKSIVGAHDGHISLQSREGEGTSVRIEIPLAKRGDSQTSVIAVAPEDATLRRFSLTDEHMGKTAI